MFDSIDIERGKRKRGGEREDIIIIYIIIICNVHPLEWRMDITLRLLSVLLTSQASYHININLYYLPAYRSYHFWERRREEWEKKEFSPAWFAMMLITIVNTFLYTVESCDELYDNVIIRFLKKFLPFFTYMKDKGESYI